MFGVSKLLSGAKNVLLEDRKGTSLIKLAVRDHKNYQSIRRVGSGGGWVWYKLMSAAELQCQVPFGKTATRKSFFCVKKCLSGCRLCGRGRHGLSVLINASLKHLIWSRGGRSHLLATFEPRGLWLSLQVTHQNFDHSVEDLKHMELCHGLAELS